MGVQNKLRVACSRIKDDVSCCDSRFFSLSSCRDSLFIGLGLCSDLAAGPTFKLRLKTPEFNLDQLHFTLWQAFYNFI